MKQTTILISLFLFAACSTLDAEDFTRFRGGDATGVAKDHPDLPNKWDKTKNVAWVAEVPGQGWGSPIVVGNRVFVSSVVAEEENTKPKRGLYLGQGVRDPAKGIHHWMTYCFDLNSGKELWRREAHKGKPVVPRHPKSSYAAETPTTDGERLFVLFGDLGLYCYSLDGELLWKKSIEPKKTNMDYGAAASPVVHDGQVIVVYDNKEESWISSFDAKSGKEKWTTKRDETMSWATPFVWKNEKRTEIVVPGQRTNRSYSLDGKELWSFNGKMSILVIPSPFAAHGMCYLSSGYVGDKHRPTFAIRPGAAGKLDIKDGFAENEFIEWYQPRCSPYNTTQIVYGDYLYTVYDQGFMTCHNALTGEEVYGRRRFSPLGSFTASPWAYNGKVFCLNEEGLTYAIKAGPKFEILDTNPLDELCIATPSVVDGKLLIRTLTKVYCITQDAAKDESEKQTAIQTQSGPISGTASRDDSIVAFNKVFDMDAIRDASTLDAKDVSDWHDVRGPISTRQKYMTINVGEIWKGQQYRVPVRLIVPADRKAKGFHLTGGNNPKQISRDFRLRGFDNELLKRGVGLVKTVVQEPRAMGLERLGREAEGRFLKTLNPHYKIQYWAWPATMMRAVTTAYAEDQHFSKGKIAMSGGSKNGATPSMAILHDDRMTAVFGIVSPIWDSPLRLCDQKAWTALRKEAGNFRHPFLGGHYGPSFNDAALRSGRSWKDLTEFAAKISDQVFISRNLKSLKKRNVEMFFHPGTHDFVAFDIAWGGKHHPEIPLYLEPNSGHGQRSRHKGAQHEENLNAFLMKHFFPQLTDKLLTAPKTNSKVVGKKLVVTVKFPKGQKVESGRIYWMFDRPSDGTPGYLRELFPEENFADMKNEGGIWKYEIELTEGAKRIDFFSNHGKLMKFRGFRKFPTLISSPYTRVKLRD